MFPRDKEEREFLQVVAVIFLLVAIVSFLLRFI